MTRHPSATDAALGHQQGRDIALPLRSVPTISHRVPKLSVSDWAPFLSRDSLRTMVPQVQRCHLSFPEGLQLQAQHATMCSTAPPSACHYALQCADTRFIVHAACERRPGQLERDAELSKPAGVLVQRQAGPRSSKAASHQGQAEPRYAAAPAAQVSACLQQHFHADEPNPQLKARVHS